MISDSVECGTKGNSDVDIQGFGDILCSTFYGEVACFITGNDFSTHQVATFRPTVLYFTMYLPSRNRASIKGNGYGMGRKEKDYPFQDFERQL
jgi:hypothetical protein